jgi:ketosteroid isomerase-like protein
MSDLQAIADRLELQALQADFTDAAMMRDWDGFAAVFTPDGAWRMPHAKIEFTSRTDIRAGVERLRAHWEFFIQTIHPGALSIDGDTATGRTYIEEFGRFHDGTSHRNYARYHDTYRRTSDGWKFTDRTYEILYYDATPLTGFVPTASTSFDLPESVVAAGTD